MEKAVGGRKFDLKAKKTLETFEITNSFDTLKLHLMLRDCPAFNGF
jgi:hypothetical protein